MRYALLADIHSNLEAISAVLDKISEYSIDRYICAGDVIGYGADPVACLSIVQSKCEVSICGNHEWGCIGKLDSQLFNESARKAILWTRDQLGFSELDAIRRMPLSATDGPLTLVHSTLHHPERFEYMLDLAQALDAAKFCRSQICVVGHTHVPLFVEYDSNRRSIVRVLTEPDELKEVKLEKESSGMKYVINPGSVGQPRDADPRSSFAVLDADKFEFSLVRVPYDVELAGKKIIHAGFPEFLANRLIIGR